MQRIEPTSDCGNFKGLSLKIVFYSTLIAIAVLHLLSSIPFLKLAWDNFRTAERIKLMNGVSNALFQAVRNYGFERGRVNVVLNDAGPVAKMERNRQFVIERRKEGDQALLGAIDNIRGLDPEGKERLIEEILTQKRVVEKLRQRADANSLVPKNQRDSSLPKIWFGAMTTLIKQIESLLVLISQDLSDADGMIARLSALQHKALALRNTSGPEMSILSATLLSGKPIEAQLVTKIKDLQARTAVHFEDLERLVVPLRGTGIPKALDELKTVYNDDYLPRREAVFPAALTGGPYPYTQSEFLNQGVEALESIALFMDSVVTVTNERAENKLASASKELIFLSADITGTMGLILLVLLAVHSRVIKPVTQITRVMGRLASDDLEAEVPAVQRRDEVGDMARAVTVFKDNAVRLKVDMEARRKAEEALRRSEAILAAAQRIAQIGSWELDTETGELHWSEEMYRLANLPKDETRPEIDALWRLAKEEDRKKLKQATTQALSAGKPYDLSYTIVNDSGQERVFHEIVNSVADQTGRIIRLIGTVQDITERRRLEVRVQQSQKLESLGLVAGGVAHDFNNILAGILGYAELCLEDVRPYEEAEQFLAGIMQLSRRAAGIAKQMLSYSGKSAPTKRSVDISDTVSRMTELIGAGLCKKARLHMDLNFGLPNIEGDPDQISQVVLNLLQNASEALPEAGGDIHVATGIDHFDHSMIQNGFLYDEHPAGKYVFLEVTDTGAGIQTEDMKKIFDPFFTTKFTGRGLGLAVVLGIVRGHNGLILVRSRLNHGSRFLVLFPVAESQQTEALQQQEEPVSEIAGEGRTILVVDDEAHVREVAARMLSAKGFRVITAANGREGIDQFQRSMPAIELVILDMTMPDMNGHEVYEQLVKMRPEIKVVIASGYSEDALLQIFSPNRISAFLQKPWQAKKLYDIIGKALKN